MAEEGWRVNARGRRVPSRVTSNMRAFTGEKPVGGRDKAGRRYNRKDGGTGRRASLTGSFNRSVRSKATAKNPGTGPTGGTRTSDVDRPSNVERRGRGKGPSPITSSRTRSVRVKQATDRRRTVGGDGQKEFKTGKSPVTRGKGGYAGYKHVKPGTNEPIRKVDPPDTKRGQRRSGQGRTNTTSPNAQKTNQRTGRSPMRGQGKPTSPNDLKINTKTGSKGHISSKGGSGGGKGGFNVKGYRLKGAKVVARGAISRIPQLRAVTTALQLTDIAVPHILKAIKARHKAQDDKQKGYVRAMTSKPSLGKTKITQRKQSPLERLKNSYIQWVRTGKLPGVTEKTKKPVANLPADYKKTEKREFRKDKRRRRTKQLVKKR